MQINTPRSLEGIARCTRPEQLVAENREFPSILVSGVASYGY